MTNLDTTDSTDFLDHGTTEPVSGGAESRLSRGTAEYTETFQKAMLAALTSNTVWEPGYME